MCAYTYQPNSTVQSIQMARVDVTLDKHSTGGQDKTPSFMKKPLSSPEILHLGHYAQDTYPSSESNFNSFCPHLFFQRIFRPCAQHAVSLVTKNINVHSHTCTVPHAETQITIRRIAKGNHAHSAWSGAIIHMCVQMHGNVITVI